MTNLPLLSIGACERLAECVGANVELYRSGHTASLIQAEERRVSRFVVTEPPELLDANGEPKTDAASSRLVSQWLSELSPTQAADKRLWVILSHDCFARYMQKRWGESLERSEKPLEFLHDRWFFRGDGLRTKMHNGIARLWWFGYVSKDDGRADPFELTETLLSLQEVQTAFLERTIGLCRPILRIVLETLKAFDEELRSTPRRGEVIQGWAKDLRIFGGVYLLDSMPVSKMKPIVEERLRERIRAVRER